MPYLTPREAEQFEIAVKGGLIRDSRGKLLDTTGALYVMDESGKIYVRDINLYDDFHHSSFLAGGSVAGAGVIRAKEGKIVSIDNSSGHYRVPVPQAYQVMQRFRELGLDVTDEMLEADWRR